MQPRPQVLGERLHLSAIYDVLRSRTAKYIYWTITAIGVGVSSTLTVLGLVIANAFGTSQHKWALAVTGTVLLLATVPWPIVKAVSAYGDLIHEDALRDAAVYQQQLNAEAAGDAAIAAAHEALDEDR